MKLPFTESDRPELERRLRSGASSFAPAPPPELRARILAALRRAEPPALAGLERARSGRSSSELRGTWIAAAAAALVLASAWWLTHPSDVRPARERGVVALSRELFGAGTRAFTLPAEVEGNLRLEAARLLSDTTRVAEGLVRGLPAPLRAQLERM